MQSGQFLRHRAPSRARAGTHAAGRTPATASRPACRGFRRPAIARVTVGLWRQNMTSTAEHLRNALDGRWRDVKNQTRDRLSDEQFRPHYTPNTVIARAKVAEQMKLIAAAGIADEGFRKEHGGTGDVGAAITMIEMLAMSDLSLMVKAGVQWGLFGGAVENLGTERHHEAYVKKIINLELRGCFAMTETGHGSDVQSLETTATYDAETEEFVIHSETPTARKDYIGGAAETATHRSGFRAADHHRGR